MSREEQLLASARETTGDKTIFDAGIARPRGFSGAAGMAGAAGGAAGDAVGGTVGGVLGSAGGIAAGMAGVETARGLPGRTCIALSPNHVHLLGMHATGWDSWPIATIDRSSARFKARGGLMNRILVIEDVPSDRTWELEVPRINPYHTGDLIDELTNAGEEMQAKTSEDSASNCPGEPG